MDELFVEIDSRVALITLDAPERRNAFTIEMVAELCAALDDLEDNPDVGALVITGAPPAFCAGADISHLARFSGDLPEAEREAELRSIYEGFLRVARSSLPTIAAVNGPAVGAGMNLALSCDLRIASKAALFDPKFLDLGIHPGGGHTWMLRRLVGPEVAAALVLFGESLTGEEAERRGLVWKCVENNELLDTAVELAGRVANLATPGLGRKIKRTLVDVGALDAHDDAVNLEITPQLWSITQPAFVQRMTR